MAGTGLDPAVVPGVIHAALTILERWGTMTFAQVSARAIDYAENGFPLRPRTTLSIENNLAFVRTWPANTAMWLKPDGSTYKAGETMRIPDLANTLKRMVEAERAAAERGRAAGIVAARDRFYKGDIAAEMVAFLKGHGAPWDASDFAEFFAKVEQPTMTTYRGYEVYSQTFNSQGPMLLETLNMLEPFDIGGMKRNSADYIHTITEALKLAYADRDTYYADPDFVAVPADGLLSKAYASERRKLIDPAHASQGVHRGRPTGVRLEGEDLALLGGEDRRRHEVRRGRERRGRAAAGNRARHDAHLGDRQGRQRIRQHAERRVDSERGGAGPHGHPDERPG